MYNSNHNSLDESLSNDIKDLMNSIDGFIVNKDIVINNLRNVYLGDSWCNINLN